MKTVERDPEGGWIARDPKTGKEIFEPNWRWNSRAVARTVVIEATLQHGQPSELETERTMK